ncbi:MULTISPECIES: hypothetical protein [unclassified Pseudomonas]|uniref:hypothetical protein n=1 Tax=unclassified Pseudomonas TaxID=196821 RepID=UPI00119EED13|nr:MULTISPECIES: hypothetical protein [unclassified Pseudomonas]TWC22282.1 hypothetical protein FBY05_10773 [Pseudomonas sp. SJZ083]TWC48733.1 hypothetical protein FBY01_107191 [Pseudomonas sp. SJZ077]
MSGMDINYNGNDILKKLVEDEGRAGLLKRLGGFLIASNACFFLVLFLVLCTSHVPSWVLSTLSAVAVFPLYAIVYGCQQLAHANDLARKRISVGYRIGAFQLDRGFNGRPTRSPYRPYVYAPGGELLAVLYNQRDVKPLIALHLTGKLSTEWLQHHSVPESAAITAEDNKRHQERLETAAHQAQVAREQARN